MLVDKQGLNVTVGRVVRKKRRWSESVHELYNSKHKYFTFARLTKVTFVRRTLVTSARSPFPNATVLPHFSEAFHAPTTFFFLTASLLKVKRLQPPHSKLVVRPEVDGSDLCEAKRG